MPRLFLRWAGWERISDDLKLIGKDGGGFGFLSLRQFPRDPSFRGSWTRSLHRGFELVYLLDDLLSLPLAVSKSQRGMTIAEMAEHVISKPLRHVDEMVLRMMIEQFGISLVGGRVCSGASWLPSIQYEGWNSTVMRHRRGRATWRFTVRIVAHANVSEPFRQLRHHL
jgi:hypothetical protein